MIEIRVTDNATPVLAEHRRQVPFAMARALTWVAEDVKFMMARQVKQNFVIRRPWVASPARWQVTRATKQTLRAVTTLGDEAGFLKGFDTGGKRAMRGGWPLAVPTRTLRPDFAASIPPRLLPVNLGFRGFRTPEGGTAFAGGGQGARSKRKRQARRTYFAMRFSGQYVDGQGAGIWRRTGSGRGTRRGADKIEFLWKYRSFVPIPRRLRTLAWAEAKVAAMWPDRMARSLQLAIASAKPRP